MPLTPTCSVCGTDISFFGQDGMCIHHYDQKTLREKSMAGGTIDDDFPRARDLAQQFVDFGNDLDGGANFTRQDYLLIGKMLLSFLDQKPQEPRYIALQSALSKERADNIAVNANLTAVMTNNAHLIEDNTALRAKQQVWEVERDGLLGGVKALREERDRLRQTLDDDANARARQVEARDADIANLRSELAHVKGQLDAKQTAEYEAKFRHERLVTTARMFIVSRLQGGVQLGAALDEETNICGKAFALARKFWAEADKQV